ncbi:type III secretion system inner rod subunit SctI [Arsenophonus nasoniae]|uniref:Type III secretion component protein n=1 Tax=Arsenophonus nasoniae TaxID=638 RepID=D2TXM5_9GAMM|nr:type III secretion system inner rod subunit SctI [Arsenophonus nasoniae]QBY44531.1 Yop proteins translocation protein I [Arsenophonus nasoniae]WGM00763.1 type III secretion system inner rod subunit SctI [Arsenophonus nasoniae]WGM04789.1 type III secretion system inner rod subunit SctI [Arsenophonus nasoniae]WGM09889.1 type III secretion system inner rod subunit SctI [Arsenophonus nasoniae]WGM14608.1 type III secretion system inner rod subunit SctI [Arsenophonus nasoniae]
MDIKQLNNNIKFNLDEINQSIENGNPTNNQFVTTSSSTTHGDSFIDQIETVRRNMSQAKSEFQQNINNEELSPQKLMQVQWSLMRITLQEELIAKTAGKVTQSMETLLKAQ